MHWSIDLKKPYKKLDRFGLRFIANPSMMYFMTILVKNLVWKTYITENLSQNHFSKTGKKNSLRKWILESQLFTIFVRSHSGQRRAEQTFFSLFMKPAEIISCRLSQKLTLTSGISLFQNANIRPFSANKNNSRGSTRAPPILAIF